jgi:DNA-binding response OmpR family regulator
MEQMTISILLVEDDPSVRSSLCDFLLDSGYATRSAATLREARQLIAQQEPTFCLLDLNLPDGNGVDLLRELVARRSRTRVIVMTAFPLQHLRPANAGRTLLAWLTKPVGPEQLLQTLQQAEL